MTFMNQLQHLFRAWAYGETATSGASAPGRPMTGWQRWPCRLLVGMAGAVLAAASVAVALAFDLRLAIAFGPALILVLVVSYDLWRPAPARLALVPISHTLKSDNHRSLTPTSSLGRDLTYVPALPAGETGASASSSLGLSAPRGPRP